MSSLLAFAKTVLVSTRFVLLAPYVRSKLSWNGIRRHYADKAKADKTSKQIMVKGTQDARMRVRRARYSDIPRVLRFVTEHAQVAWPGLDNKTTGEDNRIILYDYATRILAQGHSMIAEQLEAKRGWSQIRGVALCTSICPWDAAMLEKWAQCVKCSRSNKTMLFTAHCLRAPGLHDKYRVHNIMQVVLIVPPNGVKSSEIIQLLAKNSMQRGKHLNFPVLRFDVSEDSVADILDQLKLKKEYEFNDQVLPATIRVFVEDTSVLKGKNIKVYTAFTNAENP